MRSDIEACLERIPRVRLDTSIVGGGLADGLHARRETRARFIEIGGLPCTITGGSRPGFTDIEQIGTIPVTQLGLIMPNTMTLNTVMTTLQHVGGPILISQIAYRAKPNTGSINVTASLFSLFMSTTNVNASTISATFATNRGADFTQVDSGTGTWVSSPGCTGAAPCPFDMLFNLSTPFLYNPAAGNLLIEMQVAGLTGTGTGEFDVHNYFSAVGAAVGEVVGSGGQPGMSSFRRT